MINFHNVDNMNFMAAKPDNYYDLAIVDPPYGIGYAKRKSKTKTSKIQYTPKDWDSAIPTEEYFNELFRISKNQIIWGGNYFDLTPTRCFIVWDKCQPEGLDQAMCEMAWTSFDKSAKIYKTSVQQMQFTRIHPTQKPIKLYRWQLQKYAEKGMRILDTHGGSHTHAIAADMEGFDLDIIEIDTEYFTDGLNAFDNYKRQLKLF